MKSEVSVLVATPEQEAHDAVRNSFTHRNVSVHDVFDAFGMFNLIDNNELDLLFCDIMLPELGGIPAYRQIKMEKRPSVVFMGRIFSSQDRQAAMNLGVLTLLRMPLTHQSVDEAMNKFLKTRKYIF